MQTRLAGLPLGCLFCVLTFVCYAKHTNATCLPIVVNTWAFTDATAAAWTALNDASSLQPSIDAVTQGCRSCEQSQCDLTVGYGGSPDERSETSLDAMIMNGDSMDVGAVGGLVHCKEAILAARRVLEHTTHSLLVGLQATEFAVEMGLPLSNLSTSASRTIWQQWRNQRCQPNFRKAVRPDSASQCGPYSMASGDELFDKEATTEPWVCESNHDTISMVAIDKKGSMASASSSNGANHKIPGRVGDASVPGGGSYAESGVGGCASTGDGDLHLRFLPCYQVVESLRQGIDPKQAAENAVSRILKFYPNYVGAILALNASGHHAAAAANWQFKYSFRDKCNDEVQVVTVDSVDHSQGMILKSSKS